MAAETAARAASHGDDLAAALADARAANQLAADTRTAGLKVARERARADTRALAAERHAASLNEQLSPLRAHRAARPAPHDPTPSPRPGPPHGHLHLRAGRRRAVGGAAVGGALG